MKNNKSTISNHSFNIDICIFTVVIHPMGSNINNEYIESKYFTKNGTDFILHQGSIMTKFNINTSFSDTEISTHNIPPLLHSVVKKEIDRKLRRAWNSLLGYIKLRMMVDKIIFFNNDISSEIGKFIFLTYEPIMIDLHVKNLYYTS